MKKCKNLGGLWVGAEASMGEIKPASDTVKHTSLFTQLSDDVSATN